jgi:cell division protein YceG involved in septum cleavage
MKLPICSFDAKTGMLCANCKIKLENEEITQMDVEISKILVKNAPSKAMQKAKFYNSIDTPNLLIVIGDSTLKEGMQTPQIVNAMKKVTSKGFEVVVKEGTLKDTLSALFAPVEVFSIDEIFVPDGTKEIRINLRGAEKDLPLNSDDLVLITSKVTSSLIRLEFTA